MAYYFPHYTQNPELLRGLEVADSEEQNFPSNAQSLPTNRYVVDKSLIPQEKTPTIGEMNKYYSESNYRDFQDNFPYPSLSPREFNARNQIFGLKTAWQNAQEQINSLDANKDAAEISALKQNQKDYADAATVLRNTAQNMGWNMLGLGADDSLDKATQLINMDRQRGMAELYDMPTTAAQKRDAYYRMIDRGVAPHMARAAAERMGDEFREQNISRLIEGIGTYGSNGDGSLNEFGQMLAGKLYTEAPYQYGNIVNSYASPKDLFAANRAMEQTTMNNLAAWDRALLDALNARDIANEKLNQSNQFHNDDMKYKYDKLQFDAIPALAKLEKDNENKIQREIQSLADAVYGGDYNKAADAFMRQRYSNSFKVDKNEDGSVKLSDQEKIKNKVEFRMAMIEDYINQGNVEEAKNRVNEWRTAMQSEDFKDAEYLDKESGEFLLGLLKLYDDVADKKITVEEYNQKLKALKASIERVNYADIIRSNPSASTDQKQADILNNKKTRDNNSTNDNGWNDAVKRYFQSQGWE